MCKDWKKELEEYVARATKKQHISDAYLIAVASPERKTKLSNAGKGKTLSEERKANMRKARANQESRPHSEESKLKISEVKKGKPAHNKNIPHSEKAKQKMSENSPKKGKPAYNKGKPSPNKGVPKPKLTCPHCGQEGGNSQMKRWHFDNCKLKRD